MRITQRLQATAVQHWLLQRKNLSQRPLPGDQVQSDQFGPRLTDRFLRQSQSHGDAGVAVERQPLLITDGREKEIQQNRVTRESRGVVVQESAVHP